MTDINFDELLGSPQVKRWHQASKLKKLKGTQDPFEVPYPLEVWNYEPCHRHDKPEADCKWHECGGHPYRHQKITASYSYVAERSLVGNSTGTGKQQPVTEPVLTPTGWKPIGDLKPGDYVIGSDGKPTQVVEVHPQTERRTFKVTFNDGSWTLTGPDHLWLAGTKGSLHHGGSMKVVTTEHMAATIHRSWVIPQVAPVEYHQLDELPCDPYLLGVVLGDGQINKYGAATLTTHREILNKIGVTPYKDHETSEDVAYATIPHTMLGDCLPPLSRSWEKEIPSRFMTASATDRLALLQGLMDTDGTPQHTGGTEFSTTSEKLAQQVVELGQSLGGVVRIKGPRTTFYTYDGEKREGRPSWRVNVKLPASMIPFTLSYKAAKFVPHSKYPPRRILKSVEQVEDQDSVCITVEASDSLYVTRNYIVTHNTLSALLTLALAHHYGKKVRAIIVVPTISVKQWEAEARRWTPGFKTVAVPAGTIKKERLLTYSSDWNILVIGYHVATRDVEHLDGLEAPQVIVDDVDPALSVSNKTFRALELLCSKASLVVDMNATSLQAQSLDSKILTPNGWSTMGDMEVGSKVITPGGEVATVVGVSERKVEPVYRVTLTDGSTTKATGGHLWTVSYASVDHSGGKPKRIRRTATLTTDELIRRGLYVKRGPNIIKGKPVRTKFQLPCPTLEDLPERDLPIDPYVMGVLVGDGSLGSATPTFSSQDEEIVAEVEHRLGAAFSLSRQHVDEKKVPIYSLVQSFRSGPNPITASLKELGLHGETSHSKFIPDTYMLGSYQQRLDLLRGLMDTDGTIVQGGCTLYTVSEQLAEDVVQLVRSLGGWAKFTKRTHEAGQGGVFSGGCGYIYYVTVVMSEDAPFLLSRKASKWTPNVRRRRSIESIELIGEEEAQCILIDHPDHLYVTDDYIVTHNTRLQQLYAASCLIGARSVWGSEKNFTNNYVQRNLVTVHLGGGKKKKVYQAVGYKNLAQPLTSKVMTPQGWRAIGSLKVGDPLVTSTGDTQTVTKVTDLGVQDVWEVRLRDGSTAQAAGDHLWEVECPDGVTRVLLTTELMRYNRPVKIHQGCGPNEGVTPEVDPYLVGYLLGDGYTKGSSISFICNHKELDVLENISLPPLTYISRKDKFENHTQYHITNELVKETICRRCSKDSDMRSRNLCHSCYQLSWLDGSLYKYPKAQQNPLKEYLTKVDVWGRTGRNKKLPSGWETWSREARLSLLQGILDADGSSTAARSRIILNGVSPVLVEGVCQLARSLGLHSYFRAHTMGKSSFSPRFPYKVYRTEILWDGKTPLFRTKHKTSKLVKVGKATRGRSVVSVTRLPDAEVRCIEVSSPDKLYVTDSYMLTHNSDFKRKFEPMFIQFTYEDIADDVTIPSLVTEQVYLDMSPKQRARYSELQQGVRTILNKDNLPAQQKAIGALAAFTIGSQICAGTFALKNTDGGYETDGPEASPKLDWIMDKLTGEWINEKVVVYSKFRGSISALQARLAREGIKSSTIWGVETDATVRQAEMDKFWQDPDTRVMIISVSGERSLNLQNASILVMWDMQLNPARVTQIAGRVRRVGSKHKRVFVFELLHNDSQEERYMAALSARQALYDHVFDVESEDGDSLLIQKLDPEQILRLIQP